MLWAMFKPLTFVIPSEREGSCRHGEDPSRSLGMTCRLIQQGARRDRRGPVERKVAGENDADRHPLNDVR
jgi:hypothetical protein